MDHEGFGMGQGDCTNFLLIARSLAQLETNSCPSSYYERISGLSACIQLLRLSFSLIYFSPMFTHPNRHRPSGAITSKGT
jgi:hypothetical protein